MEPITLILEPILYSFGTGSLFHACFFTRFPFLWNLFQIFYGIFCSRKLFCWALKHFTTTKLKDASASVGRCWWWLFLVSSTSTMDMVQWWVIFGHVWWCNADKITWVF